MKVTAEEFIKVWQTSSSCREVCRKTGLALPTIRSRSVNYRKKGVNLKKMSGAPKKDWEALAALAKILAD